MITLFGLLFVKTGKFKKDMGKYRANLKDDRESGDYEVFSYIDKETAKTALSEKNGHSVRLKITNGGCDEKGRDYKITE